MYDNLLDYFIGQKVLLIEFLPFVLLIFPFVAFHFFATKHREDAKVVLGDFYEQWQQVGFSGLFYFNPKKFVKSDIRASFASLTLLTHILLRRKPMFTGNIIYILTFLGSAGSIMFLIKMLLVYPAITAVNIVNQL